MSPQRDRKEMLGAETGPPIIASAKDDSSSDDHIPPPEREAEDLES
jgi:hypothetical protein